MSEQVSVRESESDANAFLSLVNYSMLIYALRLSRVALNDYHFPLGLSHFSMPFELKIELIKPNYVRVSCARSF